VKLRAYPGSRIGLIAQQASGKSVGKIKGLHAFDLNISNTAPFVAHCSFQLHTSYASHRTFARAAWLFAIKLGFGKPIEAPVPYFAVIGISRIPLTRQQGLRFAGGL
jgi:hypothetical protein